MSTAASRILIVEDEQLVAMELQSRLGDLGYEVVGTADSGAGAIAQARALRPDLVFMDIRLREGGMDGIEAAQHIHSTLGAPVVFLTAYTDARTLERTREVEHYGYLVKPFEERELRVAVETARHRHELARRLRQSERWTAALLRSAGDAILASDAQGRICFLNPVAERLTGWSQEQAAGKAPWKVLRGLVPRPNEPPPNGANGTDGNIGAHGADSSNGYGIAHGGPPHGAAALDDRLAPVESLVGKDGAQHRIESRATVVADDDGNPIGAVWVLRDESERARLRSAHQLLEHASERLASSLEQPALLEALALLVVPELADWCLIDLLDEQGQLRDGMMVHAAPGRPLAVPAPPRLPRSEWEPSGLAGALAGGGGSLRAVVPDVPRAAAALGLDPEWLTRVGVSSLLITPLRAGDRVLGALSLCRSRAGRPFDGVDQLVAAELGLRAAQAIENARLYQQAQSATRLRDGLLAIVTHDLDAPLLALLDEARRLAGAEGPRNHPPPSPANLLRQLEMLRRRVHDLRDLAGLERGGLMADPAPCELLELLADAAQSLAPLVASEGRTLRRLLPGRRVWLRADRERLLHVLWNLVAFLSRCSAPDEPLELGGEQTPDGVLLRVRGRGTGIPADEIPWLMDRDWKASGGADDGIGLGLYLARVAVEGQGGRLWVESQWNTGACFHILMPGSPAPSV
jgi:AmiR/NasT family two-component response regulator/signal transduction histidine kinase